MALMGALALYLVMEGSDSPNDDGIRVLGTRCTDDCCRVSYNLVDQVSRLVQTNGLAGVVRHLRDHSDAFMSDAGERVWIHRYDSNADAYIYLYHGDPSLHQKTASEASDVLSDRCGCADPRHVMATIARHVKTEGVVEYPWYDIKTGDEVRKRSYVRRVGDGVYIGCGAAIKPQRDADRVGVAILLGGFALVNWWWRGLDVDRYMGRSAMPVYVGIGIVFAFFMYRTSTPVRSAKNERDSLDKTDRGAVALAGLALSLSLFATRVATVADGPDDANVFTRILATAFLLLTPTLIQGCTTNVTARAIRREAQLKFAVLLNSIALLVVALLTSNLAIAA